MIKLLLMLAVVAAAALGVWWIESNSAQSSAAAAKKRGEPMSDTGVPVLAGTAGVKSFPIVVRGIGSVQAFNTVTVRSRVDGNIVKVAYSEGQAVNKGDLLVEIDPRPYQAQLEQAQANKAKDQASLANAQRDLARYAALLPTQLGVTRQQYDTQKAQVTQLSAAVQADQAQIDAARLNVSYCSVNSPIDGVTGLRLVDIGNLVQASAATPLVVVTQIKPVFVTFTVAERDLDRIRAAMTRHSLTVLAYNADDSKELSQGVLKLINNSVDQATGTVTLKAEFANQKAELWPGEFVNAHLVLKMIKDGVTVPIGAVQMGPSGAFIYVIQANSTAAVQPVKVVDVENGLALIGSGLRAGEKIVLSGQADLTPGAKVTIRPGAPDAIIAHEPEVGPEGVGSTGITTGPGGISGVTPR